MAPILHISEGANLAIHALAYLAAEKGRLASVSEMSEALAVSKNHLSKVMTRLNSLGVVRSRRGPAGGFVLERAPKELSLLEIIELIEGPVDEPGCLLGTPKCGTDVCVLHGLSRSVHDLVTAFLARTRLSDMPTLGG